MTKILAALLLSVAVLTPGVLWAQEGKGPPDGFRRGPPKEVEILRSTTPPQSRGDVAQELFGPPDANPCDTDPMAVCEPNRL